MRGDFSRLTLDARKHYTAVLATGRPQLDSDFNEAAEITRHVERSRFTDALGSFAVPRGAGFEVHVDSEGELALSAGRIYAGGCFVT
jgi:hypothetical protein